VDACVAAAVQMASGPNVGANLIEAERLIANAVDAGAQLVVLPENFAHFGIEPTDVLQHREADGDGPLQTFLSQQAQRHAIWLVGGTIPLFCSVQDRAKSACLIFDPSGERLARYDKMHMFDVRHPEVDEQYRESDVMESGDDILVLDMPFGRLGVAICYDLRFPEQFRQMAASGVDVIAVPSAFTALTGQAHWDVLVRARAIENLCYVVASGQGGYHLNGRETHGNSMIVDPWGSVMDQLPQGSGFVSATLDRERLDSVRRNFPALNHMRLTCE